MIDEEMSVSVRTHLKITDKTDVEKPKVIISSIINDNGKTINNTNKSENGTKNE